MIRTVVFLLSVAAAAAAAGTPGRLAVWSARANNRRRTTNGPAVRDATSYDSRSLELEAASARAAALAGDAEVVVFIKHAQGAFPGRVMDSIKAANALNVFPHVYHSSSADGANALEAAVLSTSVFAGAKSDLSALDDASIYTDMKADAFLVTLKGTAADDKVLSKLAEIGEKKNVVFVAVVEPSSVAPAAKAEYSRFLLGPEDYNDNSITAEELYMPEGTEWSIFYAGNYMYLTPDIFTGIMTMLFMFFVGLVGFTCLGDIQGNDCFPTKLPPLGKEG
jgi:hypothetical protein